MNVRRRIVRPPLNKLGALHIERENDKISREHASLGARWSRVNRPGYSEKRAASLSGKIPIPIGFVNNAKCRAFCSDSLRIAYNVQGKGDVARGCSQKFILWYFFVSNRSKDFMTKKCQGGILPNVFHSNRFFCSVIVIL
jgi:hypothetical protein